MYTREIQESRSSPVENGIPLQGTWTRAFDEVDLSSVQRPYSVFLPGWIKNSRIKEWESFAIQNDKYFILAKLCNWKYFHSAYLIMCNKESGERLEYRKLIPGSGWRLPRSLANSSVNSRSFGFFFRIHSWLDAECVSLELDIKRTLGKPAFTARASFDLASWKITPLAVSLLFTDHRSMYAFKALTEVSGDIVSGGQHVHLDPTKTTGLFCDFKGYYPYQMRSTWCTGFGFDSGNRRFGFTLGENMARESFKNNENALWIDGELTPLPPVKITRGAESDWIIQDMEGMVDLVFTPKANGRKIENFIFFNSDYENPIGFFNGTVVSSSGEEVPVRNVWGMGEKLYLRV